MSEPLYKIGEAAELLKLKTYVLRFWEMEFPQLAPTRTQAGQRLYTEKDLTVLKRIRHLLHERGLTIEGARKSLAEDERRAAIRAKAAPGQASATLFEACDMPVPEAELKNRMPEAVPRKKPVTLPASERRIVIEELNALRALLLGVEDIPQ